MASSARGALEGARGSETCAACLDLDCTMESHAAHPATASLEIRQDLPNASEVTLRSMFRRRKLALAVAGSLRTVNRRYRVAATNPTASPVSRAAPSQHSIPHGATGSSSTSSSTMPATRSFILDTLGRENPPPPPSPDGTGSPHFSAERPEDLASFPGASTGFWSRCHRRSSTRLLNSQWTAPEIWLPPLVGSKVGRVLPPAQAAHA